MLVNSVASVPAKRLSGHYMALVILSLWFPKLLAAYATDPPLMLGHILNIDLGQSDTRSPVLQVNMYVLCAYVGNGRGYALARR